MKTPFSVQKISGMAEKDSACTIVACRSFAMALSIVGMLAIAAISVCGILFATKRN